MNSSSFPPFQLASMHTSESRGRGFRGNTNCPFMANAKLVAQSVRSRPCWTITPNNKCTEDTVSSQKRKTSFTIEDNFGCFHISGKHSKTRELPNKQGISSSSHGGAQQRNSIPHTFQSGLHFANKRLIPFNPKINDVLKELSQLYSKGLL